MRRLLPLALAVVLAPALGRAADEAPDPRALIDKAIEAVGGEEKLAKTRAYSQKVKGTFHGPNGAAGFTGEWTASLPDRVRQTTDSESEGMKFHVVRVVAGDKGWLRVNNTLEELDKDQVADLRGQLYAAWVATLVPLKDKDFTLAALPEAKVGDRAAVGVKVTREGRPDVSLYFDKEKGWLLGAEYPVKVGGRTAPQTVLYEDYQDRDGLKWPMKTTVRRDGKALVEATVAEFTPLEKADEKAFEKP